MLSYSFSGKTLNEVIVNFQVAQSDAASEVFSGANPNDSLLNLGRELPDHLTEIEKVSLVGLLSLQAVCDERFPLQDTQDTEDESPAKKLCQRPQERKPCVGPDHTVIEISDELSTGSEVRTLPSEERLTGLVFESDLTKYAGEALVSEHFNQRALVQDLRTLQGNNYLNDTVSDMLRPGQSGTAHCNVFPSPIICNEISKQGSYQVNHAPTLLFEIYFTSHEFQIGGCNQFRTKLTDRVAHMLTSWQGVPLLHKI